MSTPLSKSRRFSSFQNIDEEAKAVEKQGIVTILGSDCERTKAASLRRTLSADMSSKKWLAQNGFSPMKKIASSERISASLADSSSSSEGEEDYEERKEKLEGRAQFDMWSSILSQKANEDTSTPLPPPYIHPLVKRSASSLNEKSLEICTESLGSETGSDGFSSYPSSETGEEEEEEEQQQLQLQEDLKMIMCSESFDGEELRVAKYNNHYANSCKKSEAKSFPPPLPSLSREDGASLRMQSRRDNGRLVLEAVSVPLQNRFRAQRHDGRLVLTLVDSATLSNEVAEDEEEEEEQEELGDFEEVYDDDDEDEDEDEEDEREEGDEEDEEMEQAPTFSSRVINVHRLALMMNKPIGIAGRNPTWPRKFNEVVKFQDDETEPELTQVTKSLPPRPRVARLMPSKPAASSTASVNSYEYYWRAKPTQNPAAAVKNNTNNLIISKNIAAANDQNRGNKGDYFLPLSKGCKEPRRSLLFWEPYCIATS